MDHGYDDGILYDSICLLRFFLLKIGQTVIVLIYTLFHLKKILMSC